MAELRQKRCGEELANYTEQLKDLSVREAYRLMYSHECDFHRDAESCEKLKEVFEGISKTLKELSGTQNDLAKCLGRIAK